MNIWVANSSDKLFDNDCCKVGARNGHLRIKTFDNSYITDVESVEVNDYVVVVTTTTGIWVEFTLHDSGTNYCDSKKQKDFWARSARELYNSITKYCL